MRKVGEGTIVPRWGPGTWQDADVRLDLMEEQTRRALDGRWAIASIGVVDTPEPEVKLEDLGLIRGESVLEAVKRGTRPTLIGPDGRPVGG